MRYHIEDKIYRPHLPLWRVLLGIFFAGLTLLLIHHTFSQTGEIEHIASFIAALILGSVAFLFNFSLYDWYFSHNTVNGMSGLAVSFSPDEINREIAALNFQEIVENIGIYTAGNWLAPQAPNYGLFILLPFGMIRFVS
ncbi:MAG: hypothetical protein GX217_07735 [Clostridiaceae bacterium]|nr:hypothetical protein [Clostridiaceae bacterium]